MTIDKNPLRFKATLKDRYDWSDEVLEAEWEAAGANPNAIWAKDDYGVWTISLLRVHTASAARELSHTKGIRQHQVVETDDVEIWDRSL